MLWLAGDVKEPTRLSQREGHEVPGVVVWPLLFKSGLGWEMLGDISYIKLLYNPRVNMVFTFTAPSSCIYTTHNPQSSIRSDEGLTLEMSAFESLYNGP